MAERVARKCLAVVYVVSRRLREYGYELNECHDILSRSQIEEPENRFHAVL